MCEHHEPRGISRRGLGALGLGALGAAGFAAFGGIARAANVTALGLTCIDYRLVDDGMRFFDGTMHLRNDYDHVALAGASLAAVSAKFPSSNAAFWDHVDIARSLHHISKVVVLDHRDCGAYKVAFGADYAGEHKAETAQHKGVMAQMQALLKQKHPDLTSEFWLMGLDDKVVRLL